jgi:murein DD-endopeptidase MepM/ murein hydrolase activator NlpD
MNVILVSGKSSTVRSITLTKRHLAVAGSGVVLAILLLAALLHYVSLRHAVVNQSPYLRAMLSTIQAQQNEQVRSYLRQSLNTMAAKMGEMQAQLLRLDALGERLSKAAGIKPQEFMFDRPPARGGAESSMPAQELSMEDLGAQLDQLARRIEERTDAMGVLQTRLAHEHAKQQFIPTSLPVNAGYYSSNYGWRIDPFTGLNAFHEGIDFMAEVGTPIEAAAGGVVVFAGRHPQYGNMVEVDHGNDLVTRYAHASKLLVKVGDVVLRGSKIAEVGTTGRSTGAHLHFEVRQRGASQNPTRFLRLPG